jgi:hypothetical protein
MQARPYQSTSCSTQNLRQTDGQAFITLAIQSLLMIKTQLLLKVLYVRYTHTHMHTHIHKQTHTYSRRQRQLWSVLWTFYMPQVGGHLAWLLYWWAPWRYWVRAMCLCVCMCMCVYVYVCMCMCVYASIVLLKLRTP